FFAFPAYCAEQVPMPTTQPNQRAELGLGVPKRAAPPGFSIKGTIVIKSGLEAQKPNLTRAVVYLNSNAKLDATPPPAAPAIMAQRDKTFVPSFMVISSGTTVEFPNEDDYDHNV